MADQRVLAEELERTTAAYEERLMGLAGRLSAMSPEDVEREARTLRDAQDALRRMLRRIDASSKSARELERELADWEARGEDDAPLHADHPSVRAEIARSELASRERARRLVAIPLDASPFRIMAEPVAQHYEEVEETMPAYEPVSVESLPHPDPMHLIHVIRLETKEAERWHGNPDPDHDALIQVKQVKYLHSILKRLDRERGVRRDRTAFTIQMRETS